MDELNIMVESGLNLGIEINSRDIEKFLKYKRILKQYNKKVNITAITNDIEIIIKHFIDSLSCFLIEDFFDRCSVIDVGSGGGFPGIPIKIIKPSLRLTCLDSSLKRVEFLKKVVEELNLDDVNVIHGRAEEVAHEKLYREMYDKVVARAVAHLRILVEYCIPFLKTGGSFICLKGPGAYKEMEESDRAIRLLGGIIDKKKEFQLPYLNEKRVLIVIKKIKECPEKYPRRPGLPSKKPL
ncbi:MAG: rRNA (guanine527-N7)-methyltransferase [Thermosediminibacterales bacterium]|nr:rRNA (guanine527-N7)-methyltransferase [Thermosediminibacterales bacterium]MDK2835698.1 rRNA (guanine527-N7)-methyltransferase [Thermosediminibacterales bacterium]